MSVYISKCAEDTLAFAANYVKTLKKGTVVVLNGEMGAGKTVFAQGAAKGLGITEQVTSPTYAYMNDYDGVLYHYDCYRLKNGMQAEALGLTEYFYSDGICLVEWAQNIADVLPEEYVTVNIRKLSETEREIECL